MEATPDGASLKLPKYFVCCILNKMGRVAQYSYWLRTGRSGDRISVGARFSAPVQTGPGAHPASCTMGTGSFPGVNSGRGRDADPLPPSSAVGHERVELYLYFPYGPYGLYRASVPVQGCTLPLPYFISTAKPLQHPKCGSTFLYNISDFRKIIASWMVSRLRSFVLPVKAICRWR